MRSAKPRRDFHATLFFRFVAAAFLLSLFCAYAQDSSGDNSTLRTDRPEISLTVRNSAGEPITTAGTAKLLREGVPLGDAGLSHGRAFFGSLPFGDYTLIVEATGYKSTQKEVNLSVAMRYEVDANLQLDAAPNGPAGAPAKPVLAPKAKESLDKSQKALSKNKLSEAEKYLAEAIQLAPSHPDVLYLQGVLFLKRENWVQAQSVLQKAAQMDPTNGGAFSALGMAFADQGNYEAAVGPLEKSLQLDSGNWETRWVLGEAYYHRQQYDQAVTNSQLALTESKGKEPKIELLVARALTAVGKYEDAAQALRDFLKRYGDRPEAPTARRWLDGLASNGKIHSK
jgi:Flp pilus assembly protein TadD